MKKTIVIIMMIFSVSVMFEKAHAQDFILLEILIAHHKKQSDYLLRRSSLDLSKNGIALLERNNTEKYTEIAKDISNRMNGLFSYVTFAAEMAYITTVAKEVGKLEAEAVELAIKGKANDPRLMTMLVDVQVEFAQMIRKMVMISAFVVSSGIGVTMATPQQRSEFTNMLLKELNFMRSRLCQFKSYARSICFLGKPTLSDWKDVYNRAFGEVESQTIMDKIRVDIQNIGRDE